MSQMMSCSISKVRCNNLVIPEKASFKIAKEIVFPTDCNLFYIAVVLKKI